MQFEQTTTRHGSKLFVFPMPHVESVAVGVLVFTGTRDEAWPKEAGIAHALEHMVFHGNDRHPDSKSVAAEIEDVGGRLNAWTSKEATFYHRVVPKNAFAIAVNSLASQVRAPLFRNDDIPKEMQNIVQEIKRAYDAPAGQCFRVFDSMIYGDHALSKETLGTGESVLGFASEDFKAFHERHYHPQNFLFIAVGNTTLSEAELFFDTAAFGTQSWKPGTIRIPEPVTMCGRTKSIERDIKQANVCTGTLIGPSTDDTKALGFFCTMLDGGMSFPMFQEVRDKRGLCYAIDVDLTLRSDHGIFYVYIGTEHSRVEEALACIHDVIIASVGDERLFEKARTNLLGKNAVRFTSPDSVLSQATGDILNFGKPQSPAEIRAEIESYSAQQVFEVVERHLLDWNRYSTVRVIPQTTV